MAKLDVDGLPQSGVEATAEIRSRYEEIEIVVLTSFEEEEEEEEEEEGFTLPGRPGRPGI